MTKLSLFSLILAASLLGGGVSRADTIHNPTAIFAGLDKITGRIISFDVAIDETVQFGTLQITPRVCLTRPPTEAPLTEGFVEVDEIESASQAKRVFSGWMFAASPGLHGVEHPVYDVWLKDCKGGVEVVASPPAGGPNANAPPPPNAAPAPKDGAPARKARRTITPQNPVDPATEPLPGEPGQDNASPDQPAPQRPPLPANNGGQNNGGQDNGGLGAPVEVGPPPGAPKPKPKPKRPPPQQPAPFVGAPQTDAPQSGAPQQIAPRPQSAPRPQRQPQRQQLEPMTPDDLPRDPVFR
jgi:hypothetical protein